MMFVFFLLTHTILLILKTKHQQREYTVAQLIIRAAAAATVFGPRCWPQGRKVRKIGKGRERYSNTDLVVVLEDNKLKSEEY